MEVCSQVIEGIKYQKSTLDGFCIELLRKLDQNIFPLNNVANEILKKRATLIKVFYDDKLYGVLVVRGVIDYMGNLIMVIDHAIANDEIAEHFSSILSASLFQFVANEEFNGQYFTFVHQNAHNKGLKRMLEAHYGEAREWIFKKDVREFKQ